jgi:hypothetical protein
VRKERWSVVTVTFKSLEACAVGTDRTTDWRLHIYTTCLTNLSTELQQQHGASVQRSRQTQCNQHRCISAVVVSSEQLWHRTHHHVEYTKRRYSGTHYHVMYTKRRYSGTHYHVRRSNSTPSHHNHVMYCDWSIASSKASSPHNAIYCCLLQLPISSCVLKFSSCLLLLPRLTLASIFPSILPPTTCFGPQFLRQMWPVQSAFLRFTVCRIFVSCNTSSFHPRSFSSTTFQNFPGTSDLFSAVSQFQHHTKLCCLKFKSNLLVKRAFFLLNLSPWQSYV